MLFQEQKEQYHKSNTQPQKRWPLRKQKILLNKKQSDKKFRIYTNKP